MSGNSPAPDGHLRQDPLPAPTRKQARPVLVTGATGAPSRAAQSTNRQVAASSPNSRPFPNDLLDRLRVLSAEALDLRNVLASIRKGEATLARYAEYIRITYAQMEEIILGLEGDDCIRHIHDFWEQIKTCPLINKKGNKLTAEEQIQLLQALDQQCRQIVYWTGYQTIPDRLNKWLKATQPGYALPFHAIFEDELPDAEDRQRILNHLAWSPNAIKGGIVDSERGLVYRYEESGRKRWLSFVWVVLALAAATLVVYLAGQFPPANEPLPSMSALFFGWAAVLVGTLVHVAVGAAKRMRVQGGNPGVLPVSLFPIMVNAKLGEIILKVGMALIGFGSLLYTSGMPSQAGFTSFLLNAFLVGYSLDSVVELVGSGLDQQASAQQASLKQQLAPKS